MLRRPLEFVFYPDVRMGNLITVCCKSGEIFVQGQMVVAAYPTLALYLQTLW